MSGRRKSGHAKSAGGHHAKGDGLEGTVSTLMHAVAVDGHERRMDFTSFALRLGLRSVRIKFTLAEIDNVCNILLAFLRLRGNTTTAFQLRLVYFLRCVRRAQMWTRRRLSTRNSGFDSMLQRWSSSEARRKEHLHETLRQRMRTQAGRSADGDPHRAPRNPAANVTDESLLQHLQTAITPRDIQCAAIMELYAWARVEYRHQWIRWERGEHARRVLSPRNRIGFTPLGRQSCGDALQTAVRYATLKKAALMAQTDEECDMMALQNATRIQEEGSRSPDPAEVILAQQEQQPPPDFCFNPSVPELRQHAQRIAQRKKRERMESRKDEILREIETRIKQDKDGGGTGRQGRRESVAADGRRRSVLASSGSFRAGSFRMPSTAGPEPDGEGEGEDAGPVRWSIADLFRSGFPWGEKPPAPAENGQGRRGSDDPLQRSGSGYHRRGSQSASPPHSFSAHRRASGLMSPSHGVPRAGSSQSHPRPRSAPGRRVSEAGASQPPAQTPTAGRRRTPPDEGGGAPRRPSSAAHRPPTAASEDPQRRALDLSAERRLLEHSVLASSFSSRGSPFRLPDEQPSGGRVGQPAETSALGGSTASPGRLRAKDRQRPLERPSSPLSPDSSPTQGSALRRSRVSFGGGDSSASPPRQSSAVIPGELSRTDPRLRPASGGGALAPVRDRGRVAPPGLGELPLGGAAGGRPPAHGSRGSPEPAGDRLGSPRRQLQTRPPLVAPRTLPPTRESASPPGSPASGRQHSFSFK
eukprot:TRINITY_DN16417_c0_g1_i1.p1 TRINITY_DN16417_c0_g1~~TRINITY_DN16417_c0_g1_i1.p1  ORF type:complete len:755 (+),score=198.09 TRINITY_DN16417_c0_g1_i1:144-2408(+)